MRSFTTARRGKRNSAKSPQQARATLRLESLENRDLLSVAVAPVFSPEVRVSNTMSQNFPDVGVAGTGTYAGTYDVVLQQANGGGADVVVKRFNPDGSPLASGLGLGTITVDTSNVPFPGQRIAVRADGSFVVVYRQTSGVANVETIAAKIYNADGTVRKALPNLVTTSFQSRDMTMPAVAVQDFTGNVTVVWARVSSSTDNDVFLRRLDLSGNFLTPGDVAVAASTDLETEPAVDSVPIPLTAGQIDTVVTYSDKTGANKGIYYVRYDGSGNRLDATAVKANQTGTSVSRPGLGLDAAGEFAIAWEDDSAANSNILMRRFDKNGAAQSPNNTDEIVDNTPAASKSLPRVARADDGRFIVSFAEDIVLTPGTRVAFRQFAKDGSLVGNKRTLSNNATTVGGDPASAASGTGVFVVAGDETTGSFDSFARAFQEQAPEFFAVAAAPNKVLLYRVSNGALFGSPFSPFANYSGGVAVAYGDVNGDGFADLIVTATSGNPAIKVYDGAAIRSNTAFFSNPDNFLLGQGFVYGLNFNVGVSVAAGDVNNDGFADIVTAANIGNPHVKIFSGQLLSTGGPHTFDPNTDTALIAQGFAYGLNFNVGANVAVADLEGSGFADVVTAANVGNPHVKVFSGKKLVTNGPNNPFSPTDTDPTLVVASFFPYRLNFNVGAFVAFGDVDGDGIPDLITGSSSGNPEVRIYRGANFRNRTFNNQNPDASLVDSFFAFEQGANVGVTVGAADIDGDGKADLLVGSVNRSQVTYRVFKTNPDNTHTTVLSGFQNSPPNLQGNAQVAVQNSLNSRF